MRQRIGVACEPPNSWGQLHPLRSASAILSCPKQGLASYTPRFLGSVSALNVGHLRTAENEPRALASHPGVGASRSTPLCNDKLANNVVLAASYSRGQATVAHPDALNSTAATNSTAPATATADDLILLEQRHRAPAGLAERIAAASERHASRQRGQEQQQIRQEQQHQTHIPRQSPLQQHTQAYHDIFANHHHIHQQPPQGSPKSLLDPLTHEPDSCRFWEARLLSRACQSLAFHISSHFHVPTGASDPLSMVLSSWTPSFSFPTSSSCSSSSSASTASTGGLNRPPVAPLTPHTAPAGQQQHGDLYGMYDNLPAVYALKAVAGALVDTALWLPPAAQPRLQSSRGQKPAPAIQTQHSSSNPAQQHASQHQSHQPQQSLQVACASEPGSPRRLSGDSAAAADVAGSLVQPQAAAVADALLPRSPHSEAPAAVNALAHVVAGALLRLAHACGHPGCYSLASPPPAVEAAGGPHLAGVSFASGRQLARLYDMAGAADAVDVGALAGVPASAAAALLVLLAAAQPPAHPAGAAAAPRGGGGPTIPAALLARYLRVGSRSHNPLDTVRVMWALLRLQLPGAGSLLLPLESEGDSSSSCSSDSCNATAGVTRPPSALPSSLLLQPPADPMTRLAAILSRQLRNRERALAAMRAARPGELYGTWQLAVQTLVLLRDRAAVRERSAAALEQLDSALALLEAALTGSGSKGDKGSGSCGSEPAGLDFAPRESPETCPEGSEGSSISISQAAAAVAVAAGGSDGDGGQGAPRREAAGLLAAKAPAAAMGCMEPDTAVEALQGFLGLFREVAAGREEMAAATGAAATATAAAAPALTPPAWDVVPACDAEWRSVLRDTEQRAALLLSTWPELARLVESIPLQHPQQQRQQHQNQNQQKQHQQQQPQQVATQTDGHAPAAVATPPEQIAETTPGSSISGGDRGRCDTDGAAAGGTTAGAVQQRRRLRIHLQSYSALHFRTLEQLFRAVKAQAPDAQLLAPLSAPEEEMAAAAAAAVAPAGAAGAGALTSSVPAAAATATAAAAAGGGGAHPASKSACPSQRILNALALPYSAPIDMVFTDARGRRVGLCLAHLGASRRAPGELAVLQYALVGWPEADAAAAQQGFRAARSAARAAAAAAAAAAAQVQARAAAAAAATATAFAMVGAAAAAAAAATAATPLIAAAAAEAAADRKLSTPPPPTSPSQETAEPYWAAAMSSGTGAISVPDVSVPAAAARSDQYDDLHGGGGGDDDTDCLSTEERALAEEMAEALESDAAAVAAAPGIASAAAAEAAVEAARAASSACPLDDASCRTGTIAQLDDVVVLELDHDWFHLRESYYDHVRQREKWSPDVRQAIGAAMSYTELPWETQLDLVWHALVGAGVALPIRVFA